MRFGKEDVRFAWYIGPWADTEVCPYGYRLGRCWACIGVRDRLIVHCLWKLMATFIQACRRLRQVVTQGSFARPKHYTGNLFDRLHGLDFILNQCQGCTLLDVGSSDGLISYEFAKHGVSLVHGIEKYRTSVKFSRYLFQEVPVQSHFVLEDLAVGADALAKRQVHLLEKYDIVLFLGVYHHLLRKMKRCDVEALIVFLLQKAKVWFCVRTNLLYEIEDLIISQGYVEAYQADDHPRVGKLKIYLKKP